MVRLAIAVVICISLLGCANPFHKGSIWYTHVITPQGFNRVKMEHNFNINRRHVTQEKDMLLFISDKPLEHFRL